MIYYFHFIIAVAAFALSSLVGMSIAALMFGLAAGPLFLRKSAPAEPTRRHRGGDVVRIQPPLAAEFILGLCARNQDRESILGDAEEKFQEHVTLFGQRRAGRLYWIQALGSTGPLCLAALKRLGVIGLVLAALGRALR
jgi:hypothetical protein